MEIDLFVILPSVGQFWEWNGLIMSTSPISKTLCSEPERRYDITSIQGLKHPKCKKFRALDASCRKQCMGVF